MNDAIISIWQHFTNNIGNYLIAVVKIIVVLILAKVVIFVGKKLIKAIVGRNALKRKKTSAYSDKSVITLTSGILKYVVYFFAVATILSIVGLGVTATSMLATAGIGGLAIGIGAQSAIKDIVNGITILMENQMRPGDYVVVAGCEGYVESITLRTLHLRGLKGELYLLPNNIIDKVTNYSRGNMLAIVNVVISFENDAQRAIDIIKKVGDDFFKEYEYAKEPPEVLGISSIKERGIELRIICKVQPLKHWETERLLLKLIFEAFQKESIDFPPVYAVQNEGVNR